VSEDQTADAIRDGYAAVDDDEQPVVPGMSEILIRQGLPDGTSVPVGRLQCVTDDTGKVTLVSREAKSLGDRLNAVRQLGHTGAWEPSDVSVLTQLVLRQGDKVETFIGVPLLARDTGLSERAVRRSLTKARRAGLLESRGRPGRSSFNEVRLVLHTVRKPDPEPDKESPTPDMVSPPPDMVSPPPDMVSPIDTTERTPRSSSSSRESVAAGATEEGSKKKKERCPSCRTGPVFFGDGVPFCPAGLDDDCPTLGEGAT
jgi:hypothetical protein